MHGSRLNRLGGVALALALVGFAGLGCSAPGSTTAEVAVPAAGHDSHHGHAAGTTPPAEQPDAQPGPDIDEAPVAGPSEPAPTAADSDEPATPTSTPDTLALTPLTEEQRATLATGPEDPTIPVEIHYVQSNEKRHDLYFPYITKLGGAYIGVGSDQSFTMIGRARSELVFLMDIDYRVVGLHRIYKLLIPKAEDPDALIEYFASENRDATIAALEEGFAELPARERRTIIGGYRAARETVYRHLKRVRTRPPRNGEPSTWLTDQESFEHIQRLHEQGRVRIMSGDLTGKATLQTVARACRELGVDVAVLYMSNAEEYFMYTPEFVANIQGLPAAENAVVLRTIYSKKWPHADLWAYQVQPLADMQKRLDNRRNRGRNAMIRWAKNEGDLNKQTGQKGLSLIALEVVPPPGASASAAGPATSAPAVSASESTPAAIR